MLLPSINDGALRIEQFKKCAFNARKAKRDVGDDDDDNDDETVLFANDEMLP